MKFDSKLAHTLKNSTFFLLGFYVFKVVKNIFIVKKIQTVNSEKKAPSCH